MSQAAAERPPDAPASRVLDLGILLFAVAVIGLAILLEPSPHATSLFGWEIPSTCTWKRLTGYGCPGCGLTRSFTYMAQGQPVSALQMHPLGPFMFLGLLAQVPYRFVRLARRR